MLEIFGLSWEHLSVPINKLEDVEREVWAYVLRLDKARK